MKTVKTLAFSVGLGLTIGANAVLAAPMKKGPAAMPSSSSSSKNAGRDWLISLPIIAERPQFRVHLEYNAARSVGVALEAASIANVEELGEDEVKLKGNSLAMKGVQGSLLMSRYSDPTNLGGFFWTLGAGYRKWTAEWKKQPHEKESERLSLVDSDGYLHHRVEGKGATGHARVGYRYVASEWPLAIGAHLGLRHMNSQVKDVTVPEKEEEKLNIQYSEIDDVERKSLKNRMMTTPDITLDFGLAF